MAYATYDDLILRYPAASKWAATPSEVNSGMIGYAENQINGILAGHFTVPFDGAHPTIADLTIDLAYARGMITRDPRGAKAVMDMVMGRIKDIRDGKEYITTASGTTIYATGGGSDIWSTTKDYHPVHSMLDAEAAHTMISSSYLEALEDERE
ncbi:MAG TPA: hypothetical protein PKJ72_14660 [Deltaproteobacteria bacterium]|nr:hypothetical protein [Deltaproteobacteria bacterium]HPA76844.1 hypothetical protein [Deltaproteobacteria bacterium]